MITDSTSNLVPLTIMLGFVYELNTLNSSSNVAFMKRWCEQQVCSCKNTYYLLGVIAYGFTEKSFIFENTFEL